MSEHTLTPAPLPPPAATVMLTRDGADGLEVFMVKRNYQIDAISGAMVFPGGKVEPGDGVEALEGLCEGASGWSDTLRVLGAAAIREAFEESGILLARCARTGAFVTRERAEALASYRIPLDRREITLADMLRREQLRLALDELAWFARWVTPEFAPKRFDAYFFLARAPVGQVGLHDGRESIESVWVRPQAAADDPTWRVVFPTKCNLVKLAQWQNVSAALDAARAGPPRTISPWIEMTPQGRMLCITEDAGYPVTRESLASQEGPQG